MKYLLRCFWNIRTFKKSITSVISHEKNYQQFLNNSHTHSWFLHTQDESRPNLCLEERIAAKKKKGTFVLIKQPFLPFSYKEDLLFAGTIENKGTNKVHFPPPRGKLNWESHSFMCSLCYVFIHSANITLAFSLQGTKVLNIQIWFLPSHNLTV